MTITNREEVEVLDHSELPPTDLTLLANLVRWAHASLHDELEEEGFAGWPTWDQSTWGRIETWPTPEAPVCGTVACIFGNAVVQSPDWVLDIETEQRGVYTNAHFAIPVKRGEEVDIRTGQPMLVRDRSRLSRPLYDVVRDQLLRVTVNEAGALSEGSNSFADVVFIASCIAEDLGAHLEVDAEMLAEAADSRWMTYIEGGVRYFDEKSYEDYDD